MKQRFQTRIPNGKPLIEIMKWVLIVACVFVLGWLMTACNPAPITESASGQSFGGDTHIPVDYEVYELSVIANDVPGGYSSLNAYGSSATVNGIGSGSFRVWEEGKGLLQVEVVSVSPGLDYIKTGENIIIKTEDRKIMGVTPGMEFRIKCRNEYEAVSAMANGETFDAKKFGTWELDYCRMVDPVVTTAK